MIENTITLIQIIKTCALLIFYANYDVLMSPIIKTCALLTFYANYDVLMSHKASSTNKTDRHDITEMLLKVALNIINQTKPRVLK
jgi:hypothetical protein